MKDGRLDRPTSNPSEHQKNHDDNQDDADNADTAMSIAVTVTAKAAAEAAKQKYDEDDKENESKRHGFISRRLAAINTITVNPRNREGCQNCSHLRGPRIYPGVDVNAI